MNESMLVNGRSYRKTGEIYVDKEIVFSGRINLMVGSALMVLPVGLVLLIVMLFLGSDLPLPKINHFATVGIMVVLGASLVFGFLTIMYGLFKIFHLSRGPLYVGAADEFEQISVYPRRL